MIVSGLRIRFEILNVVSLVVALTILPLGRVLAQDYVEGELIVKMKNSTLPQQQKKFFGKMGGRIAVKATFSKLRMHHLKLAPGQDFQATLRELQSDPDVEYAEPNFLIHKTEDVASSSIQPLTYEQMMTTVSGMSNGSYTQSSAPVNVDQAWSEMTASSSIRPVVAVLDTGIDYNHIVLNSAHAIWTNPGEIPDNGIDDDGNGYIDDVYGWNFYANSNLPWDDDGHGTHVSGIIAGLSMDLFENPIQDSKVQVMPLKFLGADGSGDTANAVKAIDYAIGKGARIINASWGGPSYSRALHEAFTRAYSSGLFVVTAAGNSGSNNDASPIYPASLVLPGLITVAASNNMDTLASFSNYGVNSVHIAAPGVAIASTYPHDLFGYSSGTSMAAPFIAGVGALLLRESPNLTGYQLKELIVNTAKASSAFSQKIYTSGRVDVVEALRSAKNLAGAASYLPTYTFSVPARAVASESAGSSDSKSKGGGCGTVSVVKAFGDNNNSSSGLGGALPVIILMMLPLVLWALLRGSHKQARAETSEFDLRFAKRIDVADRVLVKTRQGNFEADLKNISSGGLAFRFNGKRVDVDEYVTFVFTSRDGKEQVEVSGRIVWTDEKNIAGVQFNMLNKYVQTFLMRSYV